MQAIREWGEKHSEAEVRELQGSGYIDFGDGSPLNFFSYAGKKRLALSQHRQSANRPRGK